MVLTIVLLAALPAAAQYEFGDFDLSKLSGIIGAGYSGAYGSQEISSHNLNLNGSATLNGYYYNPNFLTFNVSPYYGQSRANSDSRSVDDSTGIALSTSIFAGSHFPGSVSYNRNYDSSGVFAIPGVPNVTTHGNNDSLGVSWGVNLPDLPTVSVFYNRSAGSASLYGTNETSSSDSQSLGLRSQYNLDGFQLAASYNRSGSHSEIPPYLQSLAESSSSTGDGYSFSVSHKLPFNGGAAGGYNHSDFTADSAAYHDTGSVNNAFGNVNFTPTSQLTLTGNVNYVDNLTGSLNEILLAGGVPGEFLTSSGSHSLSMNALAIYRLPHNITADGIVGRQQQSFLGQTYSSDVFGGGASTSANFLGGLITGSFRLADYRAAAAAGYPGSNAISLIANSNYSRDLGSWRVSGNFNYSQNQQTLLISYLTSAYGYGANVFHPFWKVRWTASFAGSHSGVVQQAGNSNSSESFSTGLFSRHLSGSAGYSTSSGSGVITPAGIGPQPVPGLTPLILFGGKSYNFSLGSSPIRRLTMSASYALAHGNTTSPDLVTSYRTKSFNALIQYRFRQMGFTGGYSRLQQGFGGTGVKPFDGSTFYVGINRWFDFF